MTSIETCKKPRLFCQPYYPSQCIPNRNPLQKGVLMTNFIALYRGETVGSAKIIAVSADTDLVADLAARMLHRQEEIAGDPIVHSLDAGRRQALRLIAEETKHER